MSTTIQKTQILELGKLPPQAPEIEEAVIAALLIDEKAVHAIDLLASDVFYKEQNRVIFDAIYSLFKKSSAIDMLTVSEELKRAGTIETAGGDLRLIKLTQKISSSAHIEFHARILMQKYILRQSISAGSALVEKSYQDDADCFNVLDEAFKSLSQVSDMIEVGKVVDFSKQVQEFMSKKHNVKGVPSCITSLNEKLNGYQKTDLVILAARPGMGKTAFALNEILHFAINGFPAVFFSLEMSTAQVIQRFLAILSGISLAKIREKNLSESELEYLKFCADFLAGLPIYVDDTAQLGTVEFKIKLSRYIRENKVKIAVVDYLQLMRVKDRKISVREQEVSEISATLKGAAKTFNIPVIALSQLSRSVETRGSSKRPLLSDLRESGSIEQDADAVMFLYRPEYYHIEQWDDEDAAPTKDQAEIDLAKYRHGEPGYCRMGCLLKYMRFMDVSSIGTDLQGRFFKSDFPKPPEQSDEFKPETRLPYVEPEDAFDNGPVTDVPF